MAAPGSSRTSRRDWPGRLIGASLAVGVGVVCLLPIGDGLARFSYDAPFAWFRSEVPRELVMVYIDSKVKADMGQRTDLPLDRRFHVQLLQRLTRDGAKLVLYDIRFRNPSTDSATDDALADAMRKHGRVVLLGEFGKELQGTLLQDVVMPPLPKLAESCAGWGLANVYPDPDFGIRRMHTGEESLPTAGWVGASVLGASVTNDEKKRLDERWLNYYCSPFLLPSVNFDQALDPSLISPEFFRDKIVVIGSRPSVAGAGAGREEFRTPYSRFGGAFAPGPALHAITLLNLVRGDWLTRLGFKQELVVVFLWGILASALLMGLRPSFAIGMGMIVALLLTAFAMHLQLHHRIWFSWAVPVAAQTPAALVWAVGYRYAIAERRRRQLRRAFSAYLSPYMADRIANSEFDLALGGKEVEATVIFTDLEGFTKMSESLAPAEVSRILTSYFNQTTRAILEQDGTIIKYIGDAVMAVWGAPLPEARHAERAVLAAWGMHKAGQQEIAGRKLRTRIGINTGRVLAGNLGSDFRFDYTLIGDTVNFASRLEGLNKYLGTDILISETTRAQLGGSVKLRPLGKFLVVGKVQPIAIFEVLGTSAEFNGPVPWLDAFATGLKHFESGDLSSAEAAMNEAVRLRDGRDGPAQFYLEQIQKARATENQGEPWCGVVVVDSK